MPINANCGRKAKRGKADRSSVQMPALLTIQHYPPCCELIITRRRLERGSSNISASRTNEESQEHARCSDSEGEESPYAQIKA